MFREDDLWMHVIDSLANGDFEMSERTIQRYPDGSTVLVDGQEWNVKFMARDSEALLASQPDRGEDYNLYRLERLSGKSTLKLLRWQYELDVENAVKE